MTQMKFWHVCQKCGKAKPANQRDEHWLVEDHRFKPDLKVIRCPGCITDWSLRMSVLGRTRLARDLAVAGQRKHHDDLSRIQPHAEPFPKEDKPL